MLSPLVSFIVIAYKQERFIREAVEGAFAQTYSPMEIILSDDCSPDRTFEIMQQMAASYRGNHSVKLNRTAKNKGIATHVNTVMALATGELVVFAAGDDCSLPHRAETLALEWVRSGKPSGIASEVKSIDEHGNPVSCSNWTLKRSCLKNTTRDQMLRHIASRQGDFTIPGCSAAWSKETWNKFGNFMETVVNEDNALSFRSILDRGLCLIEQPLVLYRHHDSNVSNKKNSIPTTPKHYRSIEEHAVKWAGFVLNTYQNQLLDLKTAISTNMLDSTTAQAVEDDILKMMRHLKIQVKWWDLPLFERLSVFADSPHRSRFPLNITSLLPLNQHATLRCLLARIRRKMATNKFWKDSGP